MWLVLLVLLAVSVSEGARLTLEGRHPLVAPTSCHAFGPQAVMEILKVKVDLINAAQSDKYRTILKYLGESPEQLDNYHIREELPIEHGHALSQLDDSLQQRLNNLRLDVLLPWVRLAHLQELADARGPLQTASRRALYRNLRLTLNSTEFVEQEVLDSVSAFVEELRQLFLNYRKIMEDWVEFTWSSETPEWQHKTILDILRHEFSMMLGKPLLYFFEDKNMDFYYPYPCGYEEIFDLFKKLRSVTSALEAIRDDDAKWKLLLEQLPKVDRKPVERPRLTQAQIEIQEDDLSTHIIDMFTGYPRQKSEKY